MEAGFDDVDRFYYVEMRLKCKQVFTMHDRILQYYNARQGVRM